MAKKLQRQLRAVSRIATRGTIRNCPPVAPEVAIPSQFYLMLPYVAALAFLAGMGGRYPAPAALAEPLPARV